MNYYIIPAALIITLLITLLFSMFSKRPLRGLWIFFLIVFLATWSGQLWITPFGPIAMGVAWFPLLIIAIFFSFFIIALIPGATVNKRTEQAAEDNAFIAIGIFFWVILILLIISIAVGYYRTSIA